MKQGKDKLSERICQEQMLWNLSDSFLW